MSRGSVLRAIAMAAMFASFVSFIVFIIAIYMLPTTTATLVVPTITPYVTPVYRPLPMPRLTNLNPIFTKNQTEITSIEISPVVTIANPSITNVSYTPPAVPPNLLPPSATFYQPLQVAPQSMGYTTMTRDATQLLFSLANGNQAFGQYQYDAGKKTWNFELASYVVTGGGISNANRIVTMDENETMTINVAASSIGTGVKQLVLSEDDLRLYVAYEDSTISINNPYAFQQVTGRVQVFVRPPGPKNTSQDASEFWQHSDNLVSDVKSPFGARITGIPVIGSESSYNTFTDTVASGDAFGGYMVASGTPLTTGAYRLACSIQSGIDPSLGRNICIYAESNDLTQVCEAVLTLPSGTGFTAADRSSFANQFVFSNHFVIANVGAHDLPGTCRLIEFVKQDNNWSMGSTIPSPNDKELFGTSMVMANYGPVLIVGSPTASLPNASTNPVGGHVYVFVKSQVGVWTLNQSIEDPFLTTDLPNTGTFGWFVNASYDFRVISVTANQYSVYTSRQPVSTTCVPGVQCGLQCFELFAFNQVLNTIDMTNPQRMFQELGSPQLIDPLFGSQVSITTTQTNGTIVLTGSPLNQTIYTYQTALS